MPLARVRLQQISMREDRFNVGATERPEKSPRFVYGVRFRARAFEVTCINVRQCHRESPPQEREAQPQHEPDQAPFVVDHYACPATLF
jgi:hypothetical protein